MTRPPGRAITERVHETAARRQSLPSYGRTASDTDPTEAAHGRSWRPRVDAHARRHPD